MVSIREQQWPPGTVPTTYCPSFAALLTGDKNVQPESSEPRVQLRQSPGMHDATYDRQTAHVARDRLFFPWIV